MKRSWVSLIILCAFLLVTGPLAWAASDTGTLYFLQGGRGGGIAHLYTGKKLLKVNYEGSKLNMKDPKAYEYGAVWNITYHTGNNRLELDRVTFTGLVDTTVNRADKLVRRHYALLAKGQMEKAYMNLSPAWRKSQSLQSFVRGFSGSRFSRNAAVPPSFALKIIGHNASGVLVLVDTNWFFDNGGDYYRFDVIKQNGNFYIDKADRITPREWDDA